MQAAFAAFCGAVTDTKKRMSVCHDGWKIVNYGAKTVEKLKHKEIFNLLSRKTKKTRKYSLHLIPGIWLKQTLSKFFLFKRCIL